MSVEKTVFNLKLNSVELDEYLSEVESRSLKTLYSQKHIIVECLNYIEKPFLKIDDTDINNFITKVINKKIIKRGKRKGHPVSFESKKQYCSYIKSFFDFFEHPKIKNYKSPVPKIKKIKISGSDKRMIPVSQREEKKFSKEEIEEILNLSKRKEYRDFILFGILVASGMRISEALTIRVENINLKDRYIETGLFKNAKKSKHALIFFFPTKFKSYLENFLILEGKDEEGYKGWLFENRSGNHLTDPTLRYRIIKKYGEKWKHFHQFRSSIITYRIDMGCPQHISEILCNHQPTSTQFKFYYEKMNKKNIPEVRTWYDKWFPYKDLAYF